MFTDTKRRRGGCGWAAEGGSVWAAGFAWVLLGMAVLCGCKGDRGKEAGPMPPPVVMVSHPVTREVMEYLEATGNTAPLESVEVRARVRGFLETVSFTPEKRVNKGDLLFVIDPRPFQIALEQTKGELDSQKARLRLAEYDRSRLERLGAQDAAAERELQESMAKADAARAAVATAEAAVREAELNVEFAHVTAPISGRIGRNLIDVGNLINPGENLLATITNDDSVYADFNVSEQDVLRLARMYGQVRRQASQPQDQSREKIPVYLGLMDEAAYPHAGWLDYVDPRVDAGTGTIAVRAVFPNPDSLLRAGFFVRIRVPVSKPRSALLVAEQALGMDQGQYYLLVVNDRNKVEYRRVRTGMLDNGLRVIEEGIGAGDRVIVIGLQRVRPGVEVSPQVVPMESVASVTSHHASPATKSATDSAAPKRTGH